MGSPYVIEYAGRFTFPVPPDEVWSAVERFEAWWGWLRQFRVEGPGLVAGAVLHGVVAPPLRYRMRLRVVDATVASFRRQLRDPASGAD